MIKLINDSGPVLCADPPSAPAKPVAVPRVREATPDDYPQISALLIRNGLGARNYDDWIALWRENPALQGSRSRWPIGWVLESAGAELVGAIGNVPVLYRLDDRIYRAAIACDWAVDPAYRAHSLMLIYRLTHQKDADLLICDTVSPQSEPAFRPLGWSRVPFGAWDSVAFWITNFASFARVALKTKGVPFARLLGYPVTLALYSREKFMLGRLRRASTSRFDIQPCAEFDARFDDLCRTLQSQHRGALFGDRSRETLDWHFRRMRRERRGWILGCYHGGQLVAFAVFDRRDNPETGLKRVRTIDMQAVAGFEDALPALFDWMLEEARRNEIAVVENLGWWLPIKGAISTRLAYRRPQPAWCFYYKPLAPELSARLQDPAVWHATAFDGDICL